MSRHGLIAGVLLAGVCMPVHAEDAATADARQVAGLFVQSCVRYAGDTKALRGWAQQTKFAVLPPEGQAAFLNGLPGIAYDATNTAGKFVLISEDSGACSAVAEHADAAVVVASLEQSLHEQKIAFEVTSQHPDRLESALQHREYSASRDGYAFAMLVSTTPPGAGGGGEAMLSVAPP